MAISLSGSILSGWRIWIIFHGNVHETILIIRQLLTFLPQPQDDNYGVNQRRYLFYLFVNQLSANYTVNSRWSASAAVVQIICPTYPTLAFPGGRVPSLTCVMRLWVVEIITSQSWLLKNQKTWLKNRRKSWVLESVLIKFHILYLGMEGGGRDRS